MNFRSHINFLKPFSSRKHRNGLDHIDLWRAPGALVYQKRELLTFVIGEIDNWLIVGIGYYLDNYLPFNKLIPKTWLTNPSDFMSQFQCLLLWHTVFILWLYDSENKLTLWSNPITYYHVCNLCRQQKFTLSGQICQLYVLCLVVFENNSLKSNDSGSW